MRCCALRQRPRCGPARPARRALTPRKAARTTPFWLIIAAFVFGYICSQTLHVHQVAFLVDHGIGYSATASLIPALVSDRFSGPHFGAIVGMGLLASAMGSAFGPWLAGALFDLTGSYTLPFGIAGACGLIAMAAAWLLRRNGS